MRAWMLGGMRVPLLLVVLLLASALAVQIPMDYQQVEEPPQQSEWHIHTVDSQYGAGWEGISLEVDGNGYPHIAYFRLFDKDLIYARWTGSDWSIETVDSHAGPLGAEIGKYPSLALDSNDNPHISYQDNLNLSLKYAKLDGGTWRTETVDWEGRTGYWTSIALDSNGHPHISYFDDNEFDIKYARWNGSAWSREIVEHDLYRSGSTSIAVDSSDRPHISYLTDPPDRILRYATRNGLAWNITSVDEADRGAHGSHTSIAVDSSDHPHISYGKVETEKIFNLRYAAWNGSDWTFRIVDPKEATGSDSSLALDRNDYPHFSYFDNSPNNLRYARWNGSEMSIEVVDTSNSGRFSSIGLDGNDCPHIGYYYETNMSLKYATKADLQPPEPEEPSLTLDIDPDTLNLKSKGRWITAYLSAENASVHDIDVSTILLQDALAPERWDYQDDVLMLKFNRQELIAILEVGESVEIKLSGKWEDGTAFEAYDTIRVIERGRG